MKYTTTYPGELQVQPISATPVALPVKTVLHGILNAIKAFLTGIAFSVAGVAVCVFILYLRNCGDITLNTPILIALCTVSFVGCTNVFRCIFVGEKGLRAAMKEFLSEGEGNTNL